MTLHFALLLNELKSSRTTRLVVTRVELVGEAMNMGSSSASGAPKVPVTSGREDGLGDGDTTMALAGLWIEEAVVRRSSSRRDMSTVGGGGRTQSSGGMGKSSGGGEHHRGGGGQVRGGEGSGSGQRRGGVGGRGRSLALGPDRHGGV